MKIIETKYFFNLQNTEYIYFNVLSSSTETRIDLLLMSQDINEYSPIQDRRLEMNQTSGQWRHTKRAGERVPFDRSGGREFVEAWEERGRGIFEVQGGESDGDRWWWGL